MSRSVFSLLAAALIAGGLTAVISAALLIRRLPIRWARMLIGLFLLIYGLAIVLRPWPWPVIDLAVLTGAVGGALLLEGMLQTPGAVGVFLGVAAAVDIFSMSGGLSRRLIDAYREGASDLLLYLALVIPINQRVIPVVGIADLVVSAAAATALIRMGLGTLAVGGAITAGLLGALAFGLWQGGAPALPFIAVAVLFLVRRRWSKGAKQK